MRKKCAAKPSTMDVNRRVEDNRINKSHRRYRRTMIFIALRTLITPISLRQ